MSSRRTPPIAAVVNGAWLIADQQFSLTTSRHQSAVRHGAALSGLDSTGRTAFSVDRAL